MALSLPNNPDLEHFRRDARRLQRAVRTGTQQALTLVDRHHPGGAPADSAGFPLTAAQHVVARAHGFASWPKLREYLLLAEPLRRDPTVAPADSGLAGEFSALACLQYSQSDDPARWAMAESLLVDHPELPADDPSAAAAAGDPGAVARHLESDPGAARRQAGPHRWPPLLYLVYSRVQQIDALESAKLLLDNGADPNAGYLWQGLPTPFTALTGCFGEGEAGPGRQPRHRQEQALARLLLDNGAVANDGQALYNRMFGRDNSHLELLFEYGLGTGDQGVWQRRLGDAAETVDEMMTRQLDWAAEHGFTGRLELLARNGFSRSATAPPALDIHRAGSPEAVSELTAAGADLDARRDGHTALHHFAWIGDAEMVQALLDAGADPDVIDDEHHTTPLGWAEYGRQPMTEALLRPVTAARPEV